jgi:hypothetical protein
MWRKRAKPVVDFGERRAARGIAGLGALVQSEGSRPGAGNPVVVRGMDQRADRRGVRRAHGQRAALAVDFWAQGVPALYFEYVWRRRELWTQLENGIENI